MDGILAIIFIFCNILLLTHYGSSYPLCTNLGSPFTLKSSLSFCKFNGSVCCNSTEDVGLQKQFKSMNVSAYGCAALMKSVLCSRCDPFSAELYRIATAPRVLPVLCNSTVLVNSTESQLAATTDFCSKVWDGCHNVSISNSPFASDKGGTVVNSSSKLTDLWESKSAFCNEFGGASDDGSVCFDGGPVSLNSSESPTLPNGICLEKIANGSYLNMVAHPDGSNRVFLADQPGKIWLATVPAEGSGETLGIDESNPFLDLTDEVYYDTELGMMGIAFHPNFQKHGRFFASFNCDKVKWPECSGRCSCNSDMGCDPSTLPSENGAQPCQYHSIIAEFSANGTTSQPYLVTRVQPQEVRRIFTMGLPFAAHHGGQILFGPEDGYLYFMMGDGGSRGDPYNFSQNKKSLLGKILRLDIDNIPSAQMITDLGLWGNYSVPGDNPFSEDKGLEPEIWALGFRNPWRCSFHAERPSYFLCADVGQDQYEEVDIITKAEIMVGFRYLYSDLYAGAIWVGTENPKDGGNFTSTKLPVSCAGNTPIPCTTVGGSNFPALGFVFSFGQDNRKDMFILASSGVYRIARPSRCNYICSKENVTAPAPSSPSPSHSAAKRFSNQLRNERHVYFSQQWGVQNSSS
ncbi:unnamed protein product [Dovyalis caffra]|uniref:Glucose/Sorbosone dehydrogenase domain-containing protein n=1 Tax=Dovyalis caffra TaxID=77055 RepID=A0AAV1QRG2_9ROSI|nr:unnamed protein product [Dovyalis caffra]